MGISQPQPQILDEPIVPYEEPIIEINLVDDDDETEAKTTDEVSKLRNEARRLYFQH